MICGDPFHPDWKKISLAVRETGISRALNYCEEWYPFINNRSDMPQLGGPYIVWKSAPELHIQQEYIMFRI